MGAGTHGISKDSGKHSREGYVLRMKPEWKDLDRRTSLRHKFRIPCRIRATVENGQPWVEDTWTTNVSASGAYVLSSFEGVPTGTIEVTLRAPAELRHIFSFDTHTTTAQIVETDARSGTLGVVGLRIEFDEPIPVTLM